MRALLLIFSLLPLGGCGATQPDSAAQTRIVSTSLCADSYVLSMVPGKDIAALSWQSGDDVSVMPSHMKALPKAWDDTERLLALKPTLVVFGPSEGSAAKPLLDQAGVANITLTWGEDFKAIENNQTILGKAANIAMSNRRIIQRPPRSRPAILYLSSSGGTAGPGTYVDAAIMAAGGTNIVKKPGWYTPNPETLIALKPDLIITSFFKDGYASVNEAGARNKVLQNKIKTTPHINVPGKLWPCAGPGLYEVTDIIAAAIEGIK